MQRTRDADRHPRGWGRCPPAALRTAEPGGAGPGLQRSDRVCPAGTGQRPDPSWRGSPPVRPPSAADGDDPGSGPAPPGRDDASRFRLNADVAFYEFMWVKFETFLNKLP